MEEGSLQGIWSGRLDWWTRFWATRSRADPGRLGEWIALAYLNSRRWDVVARNWKDRRGEVDLVAYDRQWLVFVEVKCRHGGGLPPEENFGLEKAARLERLMWEFQLRYELFDHPVRLDLIAVDLEPAWHFQLRHHTV